MQRKVIERAYAEVFPHIKFSDIEKGIDRNGWYSNERNGKWLPIQIEFNQLDIKNNNTEIRPKSLDIYQEIYTSEEFNEVIKEFSPLIQKKGFYCCPKCEKISKYDSTIVEEPRFEWAPDPHNIWRELHRCENCETYYVIYNET